MKKALFSLFLILLLKSVGIAQPGPYSGTLSFRVFDNDKIVDLTSNNWEVRPAINDKFFQSVAYAYPGYYIVKPQATPAGANLKKDFYIEIIHQKDTMKVYMPSINYQDVKIDSVPFKKGIFHIPQHIYDMKQITSYYKRYNFIPQINGDWDLFTKGVYQCFLEKVQDIDTQYYPAGFSDSYTKLDKMHTLILSNKPKPMSYYYLNNIIVRGNNDKDYKIYLAREIADTTFWGSAMGQTKLSFLYVQNGQVYAIASRSFGAYTPATVTEAGIYKLHFFDTPINPIEKNRLKALLNKDIYQTVMKTKALDNDHNSKSFLPTVTRKYKELIQHNKQF